MKVIGYIFNRLYNDYYVYISNEKDFSRFTVNKSELDAILKIDDGSIVEFKCYEEALTKTIATLSEEAIAEYVTDLI